MRMRRVIVLAASVCSRTWRWARGRVARRSRWRTGRNGNGARGSRRQRGGGRADAPTLGPGNLVTGVWGTDPLALESRGWGWMSKAYVGAGYKRPFYNKAKEMLFGDKQVTSFTIGSFDPELYCEVRNTMVRLVRDAALHDVVGQRREDDRRVPWP